MKVAWRPVPKAPAGHSPFCGAIGWQSDGISDIRRHGLSPREGVLRIDYLSHSGITEDVGAHYCDSERFLPALNAVNVACQARILAVPTARLSRKLTVA